MKYIIGALISLCVFLPLPIHTSKALYASEDNNASKTKKPNIILLLADDLGYTDLGSYGSEISTPVIDALASKGIRFTNYHTAANCSPARAMLMTGVNNHSAGVGNIRETRPDATRKMPAYDGVLSHRTVTIATLLQDNGYNTYMAGKWHLGQTPDKLPFNRGFHRTFSLGDSGADNWEDRPYIPLYKEANWYADGKPADLPDDFYSSEFLVDKLIEFIDSDLEGGKPFFGYLPFQAVHIPIQAPQNFIDKYMGKYDAGWHALRQSRLKGAIDQGIVPANTKMNEMSTTLNWESLSEGERRYEAKRMAVYGAMVEAMDHHLGRLIQYLKDRGEYDNTIFIFTSDNGTHSSGRDNQQSGLLTRLSNRRTGYTSEYNTLGLQGSYNAISLSFASASASPLSYYKFYTSEGGMRVPLIISGDLVKDKGRISDAFSFATDITPTILDIVGAPRPSDIYAGRRIEKISGNSLVPVLQNKMVKVYPEEQPVAYELAGNSALFMGDYKIRHLRSPIGNNEWQLFNILKDPGETEDLKTIQPLQFQRMLSAYELWAKEAGVYEVPESYGNHIRQLLLNTLVMNRNSIISLILLMLILLPFGVYWRMKSKD
ncbi:arylsulfatase [Temperatibacter marinus]|uniref:Arylsulfatase n=1 Tax=Temperatibacter marinus TaxID=1456591 RepID=A0AA52EDX2_9PROT|nr:arylsulfatase [Temperatibacter marinus]WND03001.1 arylsulfatase [Temperatibacter marinus]